MTTLLSLAAELAATKARLEALETAYPAQSPEALQRLARALAPALRDELARIEQRKASLFGAPKQSA